MRSDRARDTAPEWWTLDRLPDGGPLETWIVPAEDDMESAGLWAKRYEATGSAWSAEMVAIYMTNAGRGMA